MPDFTRIFAQSGLKSTIGDTEYDGGWDDIVGSNPPSYKDFNSIMNEQDSKLADLNGRLVGLSGKNKIRNGNFAINQQGVTGTVTLGAGEYGHDCWRGGSSGCSYTYATSNNVTTITIISGTLEQVIDGLDIFSGDYILSWSGTAQAQINSGGFGDSGVTETLIGGANATVEFNAGTVSLTQIEKSSHFTEFEHRPDELDLCRKRLFVPASLASTFIIGARKVDATSGGSVTNATFSTSLKIPKMRVLPTITGVLASNVTLHSESGATVTTCTSVPIVYEEDQLILSLSFSSADVTGVTQIRFSSIPVFDAEF